MIQRRAILKSVFLFATCLFGLSVVGATLRRRPAIEPPRGYQPPRSVQPHQTADFQLTLAAVNSQLEMASSDHLATAPKQTRWRRQENDARHDRQWNVV